MPQLDNLDVELTCRQILTVFARLYRVPRAERAAAVQRGAGARKPRAAGGHDREGALGRHAPRLLVARGLIHHPRLVLLDEPTVGLDPQVRQELWSLIDGLRASGVTVLMSTHYIEEAERLADTVAVMSRGTDHRAGHAGGAGARARGRAGARGVRPARAPGGGGRAGGRATAGRAGAAARRWRSCARRRSTAWRPRACVRPANLEDAFVALTGEEIE